MVRGGGTNAAGGSLSPQVEGAKSMGGAVEMQQEGTSHHKARVLTVWGGGGRDAARGLLSPQVARETRRQSKRATESHTVNASPTQKKYTNNRNNSEHITLKNTT